MLDHKVDTNTRVAATATLRALTPKIKAHLGLKGATTLEAMKQVLNKTLGKSLGDALTRTISAANRKLPEGPRAYTIEL